MSGCLFDLKNDYTEQHEVAAQHPQVVETSASSHKHPQRSRRSSGLASDAVGSQPQSGFGASTLTLVGSVRTVMQQMEELTATIWSTQHGNDPTCHAFCEKHYGGFYGPWKELDAWDEIKAK